MHCQQCRTDNVEGARFCRACGLRLDTPGALLRCPQCTADMPASARFCRQCGQALAETPASNPPRLICVLGSHQEKSFCIGEGIVLGRAEDVDVSIPDVQVSKRHAWVGPVNGSLLVRDLQSTNGTYLNDDLARPIRESALQEGDLLVLGRHNQAKFRVCLG